MRSILVSGRYKAVINFFKSEILVPIVITSDTTRSGFDSRPYAVTMQTATAPNSSVLMPMPYHTYGQATGPNTTTNFPGTYDPFSGAGNDLPPSYSQATDSAQHQPGFKTEYTRTSWSK